MDQSKVFVWPKKQSCLLQAGAESPKPGNSLFVETLNVIIDPLLVLSVIATHMNGMLSTVLSRHLGH